MDINTNTKERLQQIISSAEIYDAVEKIGNKFDLHIDQIGALDSETRSVVIGSKNKDDLVKNISKNLEISEDLASKIVVDINAEVFLKIREILKAGPKTEVQHVETPDEILKHIEDGGLELPAPTSAPTLVAVETPAPTPIPVAPTPVVEQSKDLTDHYLKTQSHLHTLKKQK